MQFNIFRRTSLITDSFIVISLVSLGIRYLAGFELYTDIMLYDESDYLYKGVNLFRLGLPKAEFAPLYSMWYYVLSLFQPDPLKLYFLNFEIITIILPVVSYLLLRRYKSAVIPAFIVSVIFLVSSINFGVLPKVSHFALIVIIVSLGVSSLFKQYINRLSVVLTGSLLSSYIRPELFIPFIIFSLIYFCEIIKNYKLILVKTKITFICTIIFISLILISAGIPAASNHRSFLAFSQHFSLNWVDWKKSDLSPWTNCYEIMNKNFTGVNSIYEAVKYNPDLFIWHIGHNINIFSKTFNDQQIHTAVLFPGIRIYRKNTVLLLFIIIMLYGIMEILNVKGKLTGQLRNNFNKRKELWSYLLIYLIPVIISIIIIYPRDHYLIMFILFISVFLFTLIFIPEGKKNAGTNYFLAACCIILSLLISPKASSLRNFSKEQTNVSIIKYLRKLNITEQVNILEAGGGYNIYLSSNYKRVAEYDKDHNYIEFMKRKKINMILIGEGLRNYNRFKNDTEWHEFLNNYGIYGFERRQIPNTRMEVLISEDILD